jgi:hypothetical protein
MTAPFLSLSRACVGGVPGDSPPFLSGGPASFRSRACSGCCNGACVSPSVAGSGDPSVAGSGDPSVAGSGDPSVAGSGDPSVAASDDPSVAGSGDRGIEVAASISPIFLQHRALAPSAYKVDGGWLPIAGPRVEPWPHPASLSICRRGFFSPICRLTNSAFTRRCLR